MKEDESILFKVKELFEKLLQENYSNRSTQLNDFEQFEEGEER